MILEAAGHAECDALAELHRASFERPWSAVAIAALLNNSAIFAFWEPLTGFILMNTVSSEAEILTLAITPERRRMGSAGRLLERGLREARARRATRCFLEVDVENVAARTFYARFGFAEAGRRKGYYEHAGRAATDALVLSRALDPHRA